MNISQAILQLFPSADLNSDFLVQDDGQGQYIKEWNLAEPQPTEAELQVAYDAFVAGEAATQYQRDRAAAYPSIGDQLDMIYHDKLDGTTTWQDAIAAVKTQYPKP